MEKVTLFFLIISNWCILIIINHKLKSAQYSGFCKKGKNFIMENLQSALKEKILLYDGSKGVVLQNKGSESGESVDNRNLTHPEKVRNVYEMYKNAGSDIIQTNTFSSNPVALEKHGLENRTEEINETGVRIAKQVMHEAGYVAASAGPTGTLLEPVGEVSFEKAYAAFARQAKAVENAGADCIHFETFMDIHELRAAILAAKENTLLPVIASATFAGQGKTLLGYPAECIAIMCDALKVTAVGANCSGGSETLLDPIQRMQSVTGLPLCVKPNAGLPEYQDGETVFSETSEEFCRFIEAFIENGVRIIGGCCGTTSEHIAALKKRLTKIPPTPFLSKHNIAGTIASAYQYIPNVHKENLKSFAVSLENPELLHAVEEDIEDAMDILCEYDNNEADYLLLNFGDIPTSTDMWRLTSLFSAYVKTPVIIETGNIECIENFLRYYPGRAGISAHAARSSSIISVYGGLLLS